MKIGMNLLLWTAHVTEADFPTLAKLKEAGYDGVEMPLLERGRNALQEREGRTRQPR